MKLYSFLTGTIFSLAFLSHSITASPSPSPPEGSTTWTSGETVTIKWTENNNSPLISSMSGINIQLMTGPDIGQIALAPIASNLALTTTSVEYKVPALSTLGYPAGKIYFIMFSDPKNPSSGVSWSTRFTIVDGSTPTATYTGGPWTISAGSSPSLVASSAPVSSSSQPVTSNTITTIPPSPTTFKNDAPALLTATTQDDIPTLTPTPIETPTDTSSQPKTAGADKAAANTFPSMFAGIVVAFVAWFWV